jgi:DNA-binding response OmpR family regulator
MRILLVEDNQHLAEQFVDALGDQRYVIDWVGDGQEGWEMLQTVEYDLLLLDVMLPKLDGISLCKRLRAQGKTLPVLLLTARGTSEDKVLGLDSGADDYVVKPVRLDELNARIRALMRRGSTSASTLLEWGPLTLDPSSCQVAYGDRPVNLTPKEYGLLELLLRNPQRVYSRRMILEQLWSLDNDPPGEDTVKAHVKGLRHKLKAFGIADLVETVYGIGYRLTTAQPPAAEPRGLPAPEASRRASSAEQAAESSPRRAGQDLPLGSQLDQHFVQVWQQSQSGFLARIDRLQGGLDLLGAAPTDWATIQQRNLQRAAERLGSSLGCFGLEQAAELAIALAQQLQPAIEMKPASEVKPASEGFEDSVPLPLPTRLQAMSALIAQLRHLLEGVKADWLAQQLIAAGTVHRAIAPMQLRRNPLVLVVDDDLELTALVNAECQYWGLQTAIASNLDQAQQVMSERNPQAIVIDLASGSESRVWHEWLQTVAQQQPDLPLVIWNTCETAIAPGLHQDGASEQEGEGTVVQSTWERRVAALRCNASTVLAKPLAPAVVLEHLWPRIAQHIDPSPVQVLTWGTAHPIPPRYTTCIPRCHPEILWQQLTQTHPQVLLICDSTAAPEGVPSPEALALSPLELCRMLRQDARWSALPIVVLVSAEPTEQAAAWYQAGATAVLDPEISWPELRSRLVSLVRQAGYCPSASRQGHLFAQDAGARELTKLLQLAKLTQQPLTLVHLLLDLPGTFSEPRTGHTPRQTGAPQIWPAQVLPALTHRLAQLARRILRPEDTLVYWSAGELCLGLYGLEQQDAVEWVATILEEMESETADVNPPDLAGTEGPKACSISAGMAQYPLHGQDLRSLYLQARQATVNAQVLGGDRLACVGTLPRSVHLLQVDAQVADPIYRALLTRGYESQQFSSAEQMLQHLRQSQTRPGLLILGTGKSTRPDANHGAEEAFQVLAQLPALNLKPYGRTLFLTHQPDLADRALRQGASDYLLAPYTPQVVMQQVRRLLQGEMR